MTAQVTLSATPTNGVFARNQTLATIVDILARTPLADRTHIVCWSTEKRNAYVVKDLPVIQGSALTSTNVPPTPVQVEPCAPIFQEVTPVNAQEVAPVIRTQEDAPNPLYTHAVTRTLVQQAKNASRMHTVATVCAFAVKDTNGTPREFVETSMNAKIRTNRHVVLTQSARTCREVTSANAHQGSMETHSCRATNVTAWNVNALRRTN